MRDIKFLTSNGLKSAKKAARHEIDGFLEQVYFREDVLKKYESNKDFKIGDDGAVLFGYRWGLFRGVHRVARGYIAANLGDIGEGLPIKELEHWKKYNVRPSIIPRKERYYDFRNTIKRTIYFMTQSNKRIENHLNHIYFDVNVENKNLFNLTDVESVLSHIKKIIDKKTTIDEFQSRIIFLNILLIESINTELIQTIFKAIDKDLCYSYETLGLKEIASRYLCKNTPKKLKSNFSGHINPLKSLELLRKFLLVLKVHHDIIVTLKIRNLNELRSKKKLIYQRISKEFRAYYEFKFYENNWPNKNYLLQNEKKINEDTSFLKHLNKFRNASAAHGFNQGEYRNILKSLGLHQNLKDYSIIYEKLISRVSYDIDHIYFNLIVPDPPIIDYHERYFKDSLLELEQNSKNYQSTFEEMASYIADFPELLSDFKKDLWSVFHKKEADRGFVVEIGCFIESISYSAKDESQEFVDMILVGYKYEEALTIAHIAHIVSNSNKLSEHFFGKIGTLAKKALIYDKDVLNVDFAAQHLIFCLIKRFPEKLNKGEIKGIFKDRKIHFDLIREYIEA